MTILDDNARRFRLAQIADHTDENGVTDPQIYNELDARRQLHDAYAGALRLVEAVEWAETMREDGGGELDGPRMMFELVEMVTAMLTEGVRRHDHWVTLSMRREVLEGSVSSFVSDGELALDEVTETLRYLHPILHCGKPD